MGPIQASLNQLTGSIIGGIRNVALVGKAMTKMGDKPEAELKVEKPKSETGSVQPHLATAKIKGVSPRGSRLYSTQYLAEDAGNTAIEEKAVSKVFSPAERIKSLKESIHNKKFEESLIQGEVFHGSPEQFEKFDISKSGKEGNEAIWFTDNSDYAESLIEEKGKGSGYLYNSELSIKNPEIVKLSSADYADPRIEKQYIEKAKAAGKDSVIFTEMKKDGSKGMTSYAIFSEDQARIKHSKKIGGKE